MRSKIAEILQKLKPNKLNIILIFLFILIFLLSFVYFRNPSIYISKAEYDSLIDNKAITKATLDDGKIYLKYNGKDYIVLEDAVDLKELFGVTKIEKANESSFWVDFIILAIMVFLLIFAIDKILKNAPARKIIVEQKGLANSTNSSNFSFTPSISNIKFSDVAGIDEVKSELVEIVDFLKNPIKYRNFGIKLPKGVIMAGPPGVGKTLIAKAVAGESGVPFYYESGANFSQMYVGLGAKRVRELFANAKANAPSIIFIDEIDAIGKSRGEGRNDEREVTLNQLLTEMDGFEENSGVIVIAATNKIDMIDDALLRPGRFDRRIFISLPNFKDRIEILKLHLKGKANSADITKLSRMSVGFSGAGLATFVNEAMINAIRRGSEILELSDFESVKNKVLIGKKKDLVLSEKEKEIQALYQGAKALSAYWYSVNFSKINLLEDDFLKDDSEIESKTTLENKLKVYLSGMAALKIYKEDSFSNSKHDVKKALNLANIMIFDYAMGDEIMPSQQVVESLLKKNFDEVSEFLSSMGSSLVSVSKYLFAFETVTADKIKEILSKEYDGEENAKN
ncbi:AAA family ATPase [Campylobacter corcagiensis]|uniref:AAA family ATPase n=1 Tax=Campylobacter corcagiensis TaxID=1448857 RepID=A0A7M1LF43_9BACT|nr:AAA family ATPase [Campylobacter corcagiensis]QKF64787.1 integral membrane ATP-dependent zinc metallopeptidase [Campylobacter corcagiensis]QOQ87050.1 AAA family ATPase [Campylobacter corcagiensis]